ncbi:COMM domain-containing protein 1 [Gouania willdenowi]|uniref:COMM domain-containing protein 1 n=1 Tax=Gouania willdenowi TaxID=441366 RepID=A0A8C5D2A3_GOUWI|nr:COMM domain-containing protein 1 [Gouania willdenowi]
MSDTESFRSINSLISGICQTEFFNNSELNEQLLKEQLYPEVPQDDFRCLYDKMRGLIKSMASADMDPSQLGVFLTAQTRKQGGGGVSAEQATALSRFWKSHRVKVRERLQAQSRWEPALRGLSWRVDIQTSGHSNPVGVVELELGGATQDTECVCVEVDESKVEEVLMKMKEIQENMDHYVKQTSNLH